MSVVPDNELKLSNHFWGDTGRETIHNIFVKEIPEKMESTEKFLRELAKIEDEYSKKLETLWKGANLSESGTLGEAMQSLVENVRQRSEHSQLAVHQIQVAILEPFIHFKATQRQTRTSIDQEARKVQAEHERLKHQYLKTLDEYEKEAIKTDKVVKTINEAKEKGRNAELVKLSTKLQKQTKERDNAKREALEACSKVSSYQKIREEKISSAFDNLQHFENVRYQHMQELLHKYGELYPENQTLTSKIKAISFNADIAKIISEKATGTEAPKPQDFVFPHHNDVILDHLDSPSTQGHNSLRSDSFASKSLLEYQPDSAGQIEVPVLSRALILYDYVGADNFELDLTAGEHVNVLERDSSGWWVGEFQNRVALFPSNYVKEV